MIDETLVLEIENMKKAVASYDWQIKYWQYEDGIKSSNNTLQALSNVTGQKVVAERYLNYLIGKAK